ncbi:uncharacterized protein TNCV_2252031 [Trichonephila clavipes]|nr:uncharacterized protein TNCV_2252031 [Trichonephila clavipes]
MTSSHQSVQTGESHTPPKRLLSWLDSSTLRHDQINSSGRIKASAETRVVFMTEYEKATIKNNDRYRRCIFQRTIDKYSACVEVGKPIDENSACVEVGTTHKHLRRGDNLNNFKNYFSSNDITCEEVKSVESTFLLDTSYVRATREPEKKKKKKKLDGIVESTDTIVKLKTKIENSSTFESDPDFVKTLIQNCIDERVSQNEREVTSEQKIELAKLQLAKLEKEIELQLAKNKALSLNPAAKVEEKQFETNIENMIKSIKTLSLPVPTRSENFNLFFQSLERAFLTKKINDEYKSEILINLLGERAHNVLLYIKEKGN